MIGEKIQSAMEGKRMNVKSLAEATGVTIQSVYRWLRNEVTPNVEMIREIARITDKPIYFFVSEKSWEKLERKSGKVSLTINGQKIFEAPLQRGSDVDLDIES